MRADAKALGEVAAQIGRDDCGLTFQLPFTFAVALCWINGMMIFSCCAGESWGSILHYDGT